MTKKELLRELKKYPDDFKVVISQTYNSTGGVRDIDSVDLHRYEENTIRLDPKE